MIFLPSGVLLEAQASQSPSWRVQRISLSCSATDVAPLAGTATVLSAPTDTTLIAMPYPTLPEPDFRKIVVAPGSDFLHPEHNVNAPRLLLGAKPAQSALANDPTQARRS